MRKEQEKKEKIKLWGGSDILLDSLTGLYSCSCLEDQFKKERPPCSLIIIKLYGMGAYEKKAGSDNAEEVILGIAELLKKNVSGQGKAARFDYDEFGILLPGVNKRESMDLGRTLSDKIKDVISASDPEEGLSFSMGVGENPIDGISAAEILEKIHGYVIKAQKSGKNKVVGEL